MDANINTSGYVCSHYFYTYNVEVLMPSYGLPYTGSKNRLAEKIICQTQGASTQRNSLTGLMILAKDIQRLFQNTI